MEEQSVNKNEQIKNLEAKIGQIIDDYKVDEIADSKISIQNMSLKIERLLKEYSPKSNVSNFVNQIQDQMSKIVQEEISSSRGKEKAKQIDSLSDGLKVDLSKPISERENKDYNVVRDEDKAYREKIEEVSQRVINTYRKLFEDTRDRRAEDTMYDIRRTVKNACREIEEKHGAYSTRIDRSVSEQLETEVKSRVESDINDIAKKYGLVESDDNSRDNKEDDLERVLNEKAQEFNDFAKSLQSDVVKDEELARIDSEDLGSDKPQIKESRKLGESIPKL